MKRGILRLSVGAYLVAFNSVLAGLVLAILVVEIGYDRARTINEFVREIDNVSDVLSGHMRESFGVIDQALLGMAEILATEKMDDPANARFFYERLVERQRLTFGTYAYYLLGPDGKLRYISSTPKAEPFDFSELPSFQLHRENSPGLYIGAPTRGAYGDAAGKWVVHVTRRISRADGSFGGVVGAILSLDDLRQALSQLNVGPDGAIGVFRADGILLTRHPVREEIIGRSYASSPLFSEHVAQRPSGMAPMRYYSDGVMRYTSYRTVEARPLVVSVAASEQDMLSAWRERTLVAVATALFLIALLGAATIVAHRVLRRRESEQRANSARLSKLAEAAAELASVGDLDSLLRRSTETARADRLPPGHDHRERRRSGPSYIISLGKICGLATPRRRRRRCLWLRVRAQSACSPDAGRTGEPPDLARSARRIRGAAASAGMAVRPPHRPGRLGPGPDAPVRSRYRRFQ